METGAVYQTKNNKTKQKGKKEGIKLRPSQQPVSTVACCVYSYILAGFHICIRLDAGS